MVMPRHMDHDKDGHLSSSIPSFTRTSNTSQPFPPNVGYAAAPNGAIQSSSKVAHLSAFEDTSATLSPVHRSPAESTPDIAADIGGRLSLEFASAADREDDDDEDEEDDDDDDDDEDNFMDDMSDDVYFDELPPHGLPVSTLPTGLCYDERMRYHAEVATINETNYHPEDPRRIYYIYKELCEGGLVDDINTRKPLIRQPLYRIDAREASEEECCLIHTSKHYDFVKRTSEMDNDELIELSEASQLDSIYFNKLSFFASKLSAGGAIETCRAIMQGLVKNAIAVIRPPGHHAEVSSTMGFCLFNNTCIASRVCQREFKEKCRKILILDWDVHHGNGCQKAFYSDPNVLYVSLHVHMDGKFYPAGDDGDLFHCGTGPGLGRNINIPWRTKGMGDGDYMFAFQQIVMPIAREFDPDFVIVAAGFDAAAGDELGGCFVTPTCYGHMTHMLMSLADGKVAVCLEGGYNFRSISKSALAVTRTLMGEPPDRLPPTAATNSAVEIVRQVAMVQSKYWRCMFPKDPTSGMILGERLHDIIREWQAKHLYDRYKLTSLHMLRNTISKSFDHQVLASPAFDEKRNLLVIMHDPPEMMGVPDAVSGRLKLHNTWLADEVKGYIKWAIGHSFGVIDVNVPEAITTENDQRRSYMKSSRDEVQTESEKLVNYLWENYIEPSDAETLYFMGVGNAFQGIVKLLCDRDSVHPRVSGVVVFIADNPVRPVHSNENPSLSRWYSQNSNVFVAHTHSLWSQSDRKMSRRYGKVERSFGVTLNNMLMMHRDQVFAWIAERTGFDPQDVEAGVEGEEQQQDQDVPIDISGARATADEVQSIEIGEDLVTRLERSKVPNLVSG